MFGVIAVAATLGSETGGLERGAADSAHRRTVEHAATGPLKEENSMRFREPLPQDCPPAAAAEILTPRDVFRLVREDPPSDRDFASQRALRPEHRFFGVTECQARGISIHANRLDSKRILQGKLKGRLICRIRLEAGAGYILQTGSGSHHTWWPLLDYDILSRCEVEAA